MPNENTQPAPLGMLGIRSAYRILLYKGAHAPDKSPEQIGAENGFNVVEVLKGIGRTFEEFERDYEAVRQYIRMCEQINVRGRGQVERLKTIHRLREQVADAWRLTRDEQRELQTRLEIEEECFRQWDSQKARRREHAKRFPHLFNVLLEDGSIGPDLIEGLE
jgi:hypothetical protein